MKKTISFFLALMMVFTLAFSVSAAAETGSITINGVALDTNGTLNGRDYYLYKILDLESYNVTSGNYSYKAESAWVNFFTTGEGKDYFAIDEANYVTVKDGIGEAQMPAFSQEALVYAEANNIAAVASTEDTGDYTLTRNSDGKTGNLKFAGLDLGYYLVDSTVGALCGLTTTNPNAAITAKNGVPIIDKQVQEDATGNWGDVNSADIGQIVNFQTIIHVAAGAQNYVVHDKMAEGLTYQQVDSIRYVKSGVEKILTVGTDYVVKSGTDITDTCTFEVDFTETFEADLEANDRIIVHYSAMLNRHAVIAGDGNNNESWLEYGEDNYTTHDQTKTYTFSIDIVKTDSQNILIDGAEFKVYDALTGGNEIAIVPLLAADDKTPVLDENSNPVYRRARADETGVSIVVKDGQVTVVGFDNGTYYLEETVAPAGYNKLTARQKFIIADANLDALYTKNEAGGDDIYSTGSGVHVVNKSGTMLPETGARGTALFITFGMIVVLGAGVLLVTKKRMGMIQE